MVNSLGELETLTAGTCSLEPRVSLPTKPPDGTPCSFSEKLAAGEKPSPIVRTHANGAATYFAPIPLNNPLCLNCHGVPGKEIKPEALKLLKKLYPKDEATGFKFGELRGMWRVDFKPTDSAD